MNRLILQLLAVGFCFALGQGLQCYKCKIGFFNMCITSNVTCSPGEHCYSGTGKAAGVIDVSMKGCLAVDKCNKTEDVNFPTDNKTTVYTMTKTCCDTDLCNAAPATPAAAGLSLALATVAALFAANVAV